MGNQEESCDLKFGSWVYNAGQLDLRPNIDTMDLEDYTGSTLWDLSETRVFRKETMYDCCVNPFVDITYQRCLSVRITTMPWEQARRGITAEKATFSSVVTISLASGLMEWTCLL